MTWKKRTTTTSLLRFVANLSLWTRPAVGADHVRSSLTVSDGITIVIVIIAMDCAVVGDGIVGRAFLLALYDPS
jgi:hypothetical protein